MAPDAAHAALLRCCGSQAWARAMVAARPFEDATALRRIAERVWWSLGENDHREAFAAHPRIGETTVPASGDAAWSHGEQQRAAGASADTLAALADANRRYDEKFGFVFIVCATGRSADAMLAELRARLDHTLAEELRTAAEEQIKITRLRLGKLLGELP
ncbi:MAG: 2-oxo-4-hydroxy-4-carboxy-5-ureidoimidazoline decarboxylase [Candidatus Cloacimonetes bacterium]|nr:2-oxo-4-hydroxy-4-carboxy-5-ureidoimidazoline decarboxylase [Candidatus Cloacimonadota bacterium]